MPNQLNVNSVNDFLVNATGFKNFLVRPIEQLSALIKFVNIPRPFKADVLKVQRDGDVQK